MIRSARFALANRTSHTGTSLSHSMSVGFGPERASACAQSAHTASALPPVVVDQERGPVIVAVDGMAAEMDLAHMLDGKSSMTASASKP